MGDMKKLSYAGMNQLAFADMNKLSFTGMKQLLISVFLLFAFAVVSSATPTTIVVRARAKDAKFIGTGMGGAFVVISNKLTGEVLAKGYTSGNSGNTALLLQNAITRHQLLTDKETAKFEAILDLTEPLFVEVKVTAPVTSASASVTGSTQLWLIPGKNIIGDGIIIELPGYIIDILQPTTHEIVALDTLTAKTYQFKTSITMLCGCTITKGGTWNADDIEVGAIIKKDGKEFAKVNLTLTNKPNIFVGELKPDSKGIYQITIFAYDKLTGNTGIDQTNFVIQ
jgi:hypothetical protein